MGLALDQLLEEMRPMSGAVNSLQLHFNQISNIEWASSPAATKCLTLQLYSSCIVKILNNILFPTLFEDKGIFVDSLIKVHFAEEKKAVLNKAML